MLRSNGAHLTTWLCTPRDLEDLAIGWLIGQGLADRDAEIPAVRVADDGRSVTVAGVFRSPDPPRLDQVQRLEAAPGEAWTDLVEGGRLRSLFERMFSEGRLRQETGGIHTGALVVGDGVHSVREDVSRHCVIDKLIGSGRRDGIDPARAMILLSGRVSATVAAKVGRAGIPLIATMSIPTTLAAHIAGQAGLTIIGRARSPQPRVYAPEA